ncbi:MAG: hypothetical protein COA33_003395 [Fluviicola sp.]|nr:hypothetical protein [Fluviicola sp.]
MKNIFLIFSICCISVSYSQKDVNIQKGYGVKGYDLVHYRTNEAKKGKRKFTFVFEGVKYKFISKQNLNIFESNPSSYLPEYGGWCAYAMALNGSKVKINPKTFQLFNGKLYLFYNAFFNNTLDTWNEDGEKVMRKKADEEWEKL